MTRSDKSQDMQAQTEPSRTEQEGELPDQSGASSSHARSKLLWVLIVLVLLGAVGFIGKLSGTGWFGYRSWTYEGGELYILNRSPKAVLASVDGFEDVEVPADNAQRLDLVGGLSTITIRDMESGDILSTHDVTVDGFHALLKLQPEEDCLAIVDVSGFYGGRQGAKPIVTDKIKADKALYYFETRNVIWPRKDFPSHMDPAQGDPVWAEIVGCELLDDKEFLEPYLGYRLEEAFKKMKERKGLTE